MSPNFLNIAKLGTPKESIEVFKGFITERSAVYKYMSALSIVRDCCDKELPTSLTGDVKYSEKQGKFLIAPTLRGEAMVNDIIVMAEHCLIHGICGKVSDDTESNGKPLEEFDAYSFMEIARVHLNMSVAEAGNMTMTEFVRMMGAKFPEQVDESKPTKKQEKALLDWHFNKKAH